MAAKEENVNEHLIKEQCYCLNEDLAAPHSNLFIGDDALVLTSNADEQLLLHLSFRQTIKLTSIAFGCPGDESCPDTVHLFVNKTNLGFSEASGMFFI